MQIPDSPVVDMDPPHKGGNVYFDLDLKFPKKRQHFKRITSPASPVPKFDFGPSYIRTFGRDLTHNNPYFDATVRRKRKKTVRFQVAEAGDGVLPHCRRVLDDGADPGLGHLHSVHCTNSLQETPETLGADAWQNRVFLLETMKCREGGFRGYNFYNDEGLVIDSYHRPEQGQLQDVGVFDSVELQLSKMNAQESEAISSPVGDAVHEEADQEDFASLLEQVSSPSAPCHQDWFNNDTPTAPVTPMNEEWPS